MTQANAGTYTVVAMYPDDGGSYATSVELVGDFDVDKVIELARQQCADDNGEPEYADEDYLKIAAVFKGEQQSLY